jgi:hypothetical protein
VILLLSSSRSSERRIVETRNILQHTATNLETSHPRASIIVSIPNTTNITFKMGIASHMADTSLTVHQNIQKIDENTCLNNCMTEVVR